MGGHVTDAVSERLEGLPPGAHATLAGRSVDLSQAEGGTALAGTELELGGGGASANAASGFSVEATVRMLAAHADSDYREWGASLTARLDPGERGRGAMFSVNPRRACGTRRATGCRCSAGG